MSERNQIEQLQQTVQTLLDEVRYLRDRIEIRDVSMRLARGDDRLDKDILFTAYADNAIDDHLGFCGSREEFFEWIWDSHKRSMVTSLHHTTNQSCEIDGDTAHTETYWLFTGPNIDGTNSISFGRYLDRLERRPEGWRIVFRYATIDGVSVLKGEPIPFQWAPDRFANGVPSQTRDDPSYVRPFVNRRERFVPPDGGDYLTVADLSKYGRGPHPAARPPQTDMDAAPHPSTRSGVSE